MKRRQISHFILQASIFFVCGLSMLFGGCELVDILSTPTRHEKSIPAEYDLAIQKEKKILVLVDQPMWINPQANLRYYLTSATNEYLKQKLELPAENIIEYARLSDFRSEKENFSQLSPVQVGKELEADFVLSISIASYDAQELPYEDLFKAMMAGRASLYDIGSGQKVWPRNGQEKMFKVGFEIEKRGSEAVVVRLSAAAAHVITRDLYDCPMVKYKIADDMTREGIEFWER